MVMVMLPASSPVSRVAEVLGDGIVTGSPYVCSQYKDCLYIKISDGKAMCHWGEIDSIVFRPVLTLC